MSGVKHREDASDRVDEYIKNLPAWSKKICTLLRDLIMKSDPKMIEDWKWGPNYYLEGMVCGISATKKHVNLVFFKGMHLKDKRKLLQGNPDNLNIRSFRFTDISEIDEDIILEYVIEASDNNLNGVKLNRSKDKTVILPLHIKKAFKSGGVLSQFETSSYTHRKTYINWIEQAKKDETRERRIEKIISILRSKLVIAPKNKK